ncbi:unnamed protein product, partial [Nesidiocoris tenuis]
MFFQIHLSLAPDQYTYYVAPTKDEVVSKFTNDVSSWAFNMFALKRKSIKINPFNSTCKPVMFGFLAGGWTVSMYMAHLVWDNIRTLLVDHKVYVLYYVLATGTISFYVCYRLGPVSDPRSMDLIKWTLQITEKLLALFHRTATRSPALCYRLPPKPLLGCFYQIATRTPTSSVFTQLTPRALGPQLWNMAFDKLLEALEIVGFPVTASADEAVVLVEGGCRRALEAGGAGVSGILEAWSVSSKLEFCKSMSKWMLLKGHLDPRRGPHMCGEGMRGTQRVRYLGVTLTSGLRLGDQVEEICKPPATGAPNLIQSTTGWLDLMRGSRQVPFRRSEFHQLEQSLLDRRRSGRREESVANAPHERVEQFRLFGFDVAPDRRHREEEAFDLEIEQFIGNHKNGLSRKKKKKTGDAGWPGGAYFGQVLMKLGIKIILDLHTLHSSWNWIVSYKQRTRTSIVSESRKLDINEIITSTFLDSRLESRPAMGMFSKSENNLRSSGGVSWKAPLVFTIEERSISFMSKESNFSGHPFARGHQLNSVPAPKPHAYQ